MFNEERIMALNAKLIKINEMTQHLEDGPLFDVPVTAGMRVITVIASRGKDIPSERNMMIYTYITESGGVGKTGIRLGARATPVAVRKGDSLLLPMDINELLFGTKVIFGEAINCVHLECESMIKQSVTA